MSFELAMQPQKSGGEAAIFHKRLRESKHVPREIGGSRVKHFILEKEDAETPLERICRPRCMHLSRIQQKNRARREKVARFPAITIHRAPFDDSYRRNGMKMTRKFILSIGTLKQFGAVESAMPPDTGALIPADGSLAMVQVNAGIVLVQDSRRRRNCTHFSNCTIGSWTHALSIPASPLKRAILYKTIGKCAANLIAVTSLSAFSIAHKIDEVKCIRIL